MRRVGQARKRDANEPAIVEALQSCGALVQRVSERGFADLVCWHWACGLILVEVKGAKGKATDAQQEAAHAGWPVVTVRSANEAIAAIYGIAK